MRDGSGRETFHCIFVKLFDFCNPGMFYPFLKSIIFLAPHPRVPAFCCLLPFITKLPDSAVKSGTPLCHRCSLAVIHHPTRAVFTEVTRDHGLPGSVNSFSALCRLDLCSLQTTPSSNLTLPAPSPLGSPGFLSALLVPSLVIFQDLWQESGSRLSVLPFLPHLVYHHLPRFTSKYLSCLSSHLHCHLPSLHGLLTFLISFLKIPPTTHLLFLAHLPHCHYSDLPKI